MARAAATGDIVLTARPATPETFAPFGRLLGPGEREIVSRRAGALLALDEATPGPRRFLHLSCYPEQQRVVLALGDTPLLVVVLAPGEPSAGAPTAFRVPPGHAVLFAPGVWHAGPHPLAPGTLCEVLETRSVADRMDRKTLRELAGVEAVRVVLPEEPGAPGQHLDLSVAGAVVVEEALLKRVSLGFLVLEGLSLGGLEDAVTTDLERTEGAVRAMWSRTTDLGDVPGVDAARALWQALGIDPREHRPPGERVLDLVLDGRRPERHNALLDTLTIATLALHVPVFAYDVDRLGDRVMVRASSPASNRDVALPPGGLVLADREGPFATPLASMDRAAVTTRTERAMLVVYLPARVAPALAASRLDEVSRRVRERCSGREAGRLVVSEGPSGGGGAGKGPIR